jgi:hypothetical protein
LKQADHSNVRFYAALSAVGKNLGPPLGLELKKQPEIVLLSRAHAAQFPCAHPELDNDGYILQFHQEI